jgi:hypothetical protein
MFGLEDQKKKKKQDSEFFFDLEKDLKTAKKNKEIRNKITERIQQIKETLRGGAEKDEFEHYGVLLYGYTALQKVVSRIAAK